MPFHVSAEFIWKNYARQRRSLQRHFNGPMCNFTTKMNEKKTEKNKNNENYEDEEAYNIEYARSVHTN